MVAEHRWPMAAYLVVALTCAVVMTAMGRVQPLVDGIVGNPVRAFEVIVRGADLVPGIDAAEPVPTVASMRAPVPAAAAGDADAPTVATTITGAVQARAAGAQRRTGGTAAPQAPTPAISRRSAPVRTEPARTQPTRTSRTPQHRRASTPTRTARTSTSVRASQRGMARRANARHTPTRAASLRTARRAGR